MTPTVTVPERELTEDEEDIREALRLDRVDFKKVVAFGVESVRSEYNDDNNLKEDPITFSEQMDALPVGLGYAILGKQGTDEGWKWEMRAYALANLPDGVLPKAKYARPGRPRVMFDITDSLLTSGSETGNSERPACNIVRSGSDSSAGTDTSGKTLVDGTDQTAAAKPDLQMGTEGDASLYVRNSEICLVGGMKYNPRTRTVSRTSVKLEPTESMHSYDSKTSGASIRQRIRSLIGRSKN